MLGLYGNAIISDLLGKFDDNTVKSKLFLKIEINLKIKFIIIDLNENKCLISTKDEIKLRMIKTSFEKIEFYYEAYRKILFSDSFYKQADAILNIPCTKYLKILVKEEENIWKSVFANIGLSLVCLLFKK